MEGYWCDEEDVVVRMSAMERSSVTVTPWSLWDICASQMCWKMSKVERARKSFKKVGEAAKERRNALRACRLVDISLVA